jgi:hypothetical protein
VPTYGASGHTDIASERDIHVAREGFHGFIRVENHHEFRYLSTNLEAETCPPSANGGRPTPAIPGTSYDEPFPTTATNAKTSFNDRHDRQALRIFEHGLRNGLLRHCLEAFDNGGCLINVILQVSVDWRGTKYNAAHQYS